jgi:hypothetical protein
MFTSSEHVVPAQLRRFKPSPPVPDTCTVSPMLNALTITVKYTPAEGVLVPAELEADKFQM